jgi:hypothetical protein
VEEASMPDHKILVELKQCMRDADGDPAKMLACEVKFQQDGGTTHQDGGKVFTAPDGSTAFVTEGGKVF